MPKPARFSPVVLILGLGLVPVLHLAGVGPEARGQFPQLRLQGIFPAGGRQGETVDVEVAGTDLEGADELWFDHPGLRALRVKGPKFKVLIASGVLVGQHDVRAVGRLGVSNPRVFVVGDRPETLEAEPNDVPEKAGTIAVNSVVNGRTDKPADVDCFVFQAKKGQRLFLDVEAERIDATLDPVLRVFDPSGRPLAEVHDGVGPDPMVDLVCPVDGKYLVKVLDETYSGTPQHVYRLTLHDGPILDAVSPVAAVPGVATSLSLLGRNLGGEPSPKLSADGRPLERKTVSFTPPTAAEAGLQFPGLDLVTAPAASQRGAFFRFQGPSGASSNPVFIAEAIDPVVLEQEPNDVEEHAQKLSPPCDVSAVFGKVGDVDLYRFQAKKGDVWWFEASAEGVGSPADPSFVIQKVVEKGPPQDLASGDDTPDPGFGPNFHVGSVDAALRWQAPEDGLYQAAVSDLYHSQRGGPGMSYRLNIRPARPDFRLFLIPESAAALDATTIRAGGRASAVVLAKRLDGFDGPIRIEARGLPPGVKFDPVVIGPGRLRTRVVFEAIDDAKATVGAVSLVGTAEPKASGTAPAAKIVREVLSGAMIRPPIQLQNGQPGFAPARLTRGFVVAVREPAPFRLTVTPAELVVAQGRQLSLDVELVRRPPFVETLQVSFAAPDLPPNMPTPPATPIAKDATKATILAYLPKNVPPGVYTMLLHGAGPVPFNKDPNAKEKPNVNVSLPSNPIVLTVKPSPVNPSVNNKGGMLPQGGSLEIEATVNRQNGFDGDVTLSLVAPAPLKLSADPATVVIPKGQPTGKLVIKAAADSPPGAAGNVVARMTSTFQGGPTEVDEPVAVTINKK